MVEEAVVLAHHLVAGTDAEAFGDDRQLLHLWKRREVDRFDLPLQRRRRREDRVREPDPQNGFVERGRTAQLVGSVVSLAIHEESDRPIRGAVAERDVVPLPIRDLPSTTTGTNPADVDSQPTTSQDPGQPVRTPGITVDRLGDEGSIPSGTEASRARDASGRP